ncbi:MAG: SGNH/GDSL hydrolase family protein, partial [Planctomycetaceae bacterium]|nr:SGNH/GDSL hydrolase family protein [Planctomycetaceae bacterium]
MAVDLELSADSKRGLAAIPVTGSEPHVLHRVLKKVKMAGKTTNWLRRINLDDLNFDDLMFGGCKTVRVIGDSALCFGRDEASRKLTCSAELAAALPGKLIQDIVSKPGTGLKQITATARKSWQADDYKSTMLIVVWTGNDLTQKNPKTKKWDTCWAPGMDYNQDVFDLIELLKKYRYKCFIGPGSA